MAMGLGALVTPSRIRMPRPPQNSTTFITSLPAGLVHGYTTSSAGIGKTKRAPPRSHVLELLGDFLSQVPRQDEDVVRLGLGELAPAAKMGMCVPGRNIPCL